MKNYLFVSIVLLSYACCAHKGIVVHKSVETEKVIYTDNNDTIIVEQDSNYVHIYTKNYLSEYRNYHKKENRGEISLAIEYKIDLSPETFKMIEEDGGMIAVMRNILSKDNYDKFMNRIPLKLDVILSLDSLTVQECHVSIFTKNIVGLSLSNNEIVKLLNYCKKMSFIYNGTKYKNEKVPAGYLFAIKKNVCKEL
jgi:hypothetical protein